MKIVKGNLIANALIGHYDLIGQGNNCQNIWGAGLAAQMKDSLYDAFLIDKEYHDGFHDKIDMMGTFSRFYYSDERENGVRFWVVNMYTQLFAGLPSPGCKIPFDYEAFTVICRKVNNIYRGKHIGLPKIGCGLAGAFWPEVENIINDNLNEMEVTIIDYNANNQANSRPNHTRGLGDVTGTREGPYSGREGDTGEFTMGRDDFRRGAPVKLDNHEHPTTDAGGRHYWIGDTEDTVEMEGDQPKDEYGFPNKEDLFD
jgi:hypothetical protein